jgi:hypothetical protein
VLMSLAEYARHRGCNLKAVQFAVIRGRITRRDDGQIESDQADADWEKNTNHANARYGPKKKARRDPQVDAEAGVRRAATWAAKHHAEAEAAPLGDMSRQSSALNFASARAAREIYEARLKKLEFEERQGNLLNKRSVEVAQFNRGRVLRDALFNIPNRMAAQLAAEAEPAAVHDLLEGEIRMVLEEFTGGKLG